MLDAVTQIQLYTAGRTADDFRSDRLLQDGVVRNIEILGEASRNLIGAAPDAALRFPRIPFAAIYAMRNQLSHGYFTIDLDVVWKVIERDIPVLRRELEAAIRVIDRPPGP
ncbi:MAG: HepT-like ribonuclease domain-containing protein [Acidobacteriaceae bacterium]